MASLSAILLILSLACTFYCARNAMGLLLEYAGTRGFLSKRNLLKMAVRLGDGALSIPWISHIIQRRRERKRLAEFEQGMPEVLRLLCIALESGSSLIMALRYAAENCDEPLSGELRRTVWDLEAGQGFDEALEKLRARTHGSEFSYLAVAMEIQHQSGGSLTDILESVSDMLRQSAELKDELRTKTSQGRLSSKVVIIMPFVLLAILSVFSPGYVSNFLSSPLGVLLFMLALLLEAIGILLVRRALAIDFTVDLEEGA